MTRYEQVIQQAREAFHSGRTRDVEFRKKQLKALKRMYEENESVFCAALAKDLHKPKQESVLLELNLLKDDITHILARLDEWAKPEKGEGRGSDGYERNRWSDMPTIKADSLGGLLTMVLSRFDIDVVFGYSSEHVTDHWDELVNRCSEAVLPPPPHFLPSSLDSPTSHLLNLLIYTSPQHSSPTPTLPWTALQATSFPIPWTNYSPLLLPTPIPTLSPPLPPLSPKFLGQNLPTPPFPTFPSSPKFPRQSPQFLRLTLPHNPLLHLPPPSLDSSSPLPLLSKFPATTPPHPPFPHLPPPLRFPRRSPPSLLLPNSRDNTPPQLPISPPSPPLLRFPRRSHPPSPLPPSPPIPRTPPPTPLFPTFPLSPSFSASFPQTRSQRL
ncbi:hypothetical protein C7M84_000200 [Penaeus vannamei]|uniref:Uncharacterized protein n=1 Tax=Penaeus vannamei TaxID=6689 RepID=A0A3R7SYB4_PENVA|nr:hypothetical protein C7M84_000200 [Penaeus vannamei]